MNILSMSGFIPEQICDTIRFTQYAGDRNISHYCGYASDFISQVLQDENIDGAVFPKSCDSTRIISSYLSETDKFVHQINIPSFGIGGAIDYFAKEIKRFQNAVEEFYGVHITQQDIVQRIEKIQLRNQSIRKIYDELSAVSYKQYITMIHDMLMKPLSEQEVKKDLDKSQGNKPVYLIGSFLSDLAILDEMDRVELKIVGDNLPESGRLAFHTDLNCKDDPYSSIAESILSEKMSPTQNGFRRMLEMDLAEIQHKGATGVIFITQQYCESYDYYYSIAREAFEQAGLSVLQISLNGTNDTIKSRLAFEAFSDTL